MSETVCAVVVTFNRKDMLRPCLRSLLQQTRPPDRILVVNNASTDGTELLLKEEFGDLTVLHLPINSGGAGGFHVGMRWAYDQNFDWVWVMDDDIETTPDALEALLSYGSIADFIHGRKQLNDGMLVWEALWDATGCFPVTMRADMSFANGKQWTSINYANFEGGLIRRVVMEKVGFPDVRYFMAGDDTIYGYEASLFVNVIYVDHLTIVKRIVHVQPRSRMHLYLQIRNRFLTYQHLVASGVPIVHRIFLVRAWMGLLSLWAEIIKNPKLRSWVNFSTVWQGFVHGWQGRFGRPYWLP